MEVIIPQNSLIIINHLESKSWQHYEKLQYFIVSLLYCVPRSESIPISWTALFCLA